MWVNKAEFASAGARTDVGVETNEVPFHRPKHMFFYGRLVINNERS